MGHLLSTVNQAAVDRVEERPLPDIGDWIIYYPRMGERRRGRDRVPALVVHRDVGNRRLDLAIFHEASDVLDQQNVPERIGEDRGWLRKETAQASVQPPQPRHDPAELEAIKTDIAALKKGQEQLSEKMFGTFTAPDQSFLEMLSILDGAIEEIEAKLPGAKQPVKPAAKAPVVAAKGKPGRSKKAA